jgi:uncharacterized membrane protein
MMMTTNALAGAPAAGAWTRRLRAVPVSDAVFYGACVVACHLVLMLLAQVVVYRQVSPWISSEAGAGMAAGFYGSAVVNVLMEAVVFVFGWLFLVAAVILLDGRENARAMFGWLGIGYLPVVAYSVAAILALSALSSRADVSAISRAGNPDEVVRAVQAYLHGGTFMVLAVLRAGAYAATALFAAETLHRVCGLRRTKAAAALGAYLALLLMVRLLTG